MTTEFKNVTLNTQANVFFDGKCISHTFFLADGTKKTVGVMLPSQIVFNTKVHEIMECVSGFCEYRLNSDSPWTVSKAGEQFNVPADSSFELRITEPYHYICHFA